MGIRRRRPRLAPLAAAAVASAVAHASRAGNVYVDAPTVLTSVVTDPTSQTYVGPDDSLVIGSKTNAAFEVVTDASFQGATGLLTHVSLENNAALRFEAGVTRQVGAIGNSTLHFGGTARATESVSVGGDAVGYINGGEAYIVTTETFGRSFVSGGTFHDIGATGGAGIMVVTGGTASLLFANSGGTVSFRGGTILDRVETFSNGAAQLFMKPGYALTEWTDEAVTNGGWPGQVARLSGEPALGGKLDNVLLYRGSDGGPITVTAVPEPCAAGALATATAIAIAMLEIRHRRGTEAPLPSSGAHR